VIGKTYAMPPQPVVEANTRYFDAANLRLGVEYRDIGPEDLVATYQHNPDHLAELLARSPEGGFSDEGVSLHVCDADTGHEYLRFDVFDDGPHYHYNHAGPEIVNNVIEFDVTAQGDMLPWALDRIRHRLPDMLAEAGGGHLVAHLDQDAIDAAVDQMGVMAEEARSRLRSLGSTHRPT
jgi:hypothetical protein